MYHILCIYSNVAVPYIQLEHHTHMVKYIQLTHIYVYTVINFVSTYIVSYPLWRTAVFVQYTI